MKSDMTGAKSTGPLSGYRVVEIAGLGPGPFCGMLLADMGAEVIVIDRAGSPNNKASLECTRRGKFSLALNLKDKKAVDIVLDLVTRCDVLLEGFRPGVMERLNLGPEQCMASNPKLVYGRMTGWGQSGPLSKVAGHDINYIALTGVLAAIGGRDSKPVPPLNLVGDFGGGAMLMAFGILAALLEAQKSGLGQVVDAAMTDGSALLMAMIYSEYSKGNWQSARSRNLVDGGAYFYNSYETVDGRYIALGAVEPQFHDALIEKLGLNAQQFRDHLNEDNWTIENVQRIAEVIKQRTRDEWCELLEDSDVCFAPVLDFLEAPSHPHNLSRQTYLNINGQVQPAPAPRFSRTCPETNGRAPNIGDDSYFVLRSFGYNQKDIEQLIESGVVE